MTLSERPSDISYGASRVLEDLRELCDDGSEIELGCEEFSSYHGELLRQDYIGVRSTTVGGQHFFGNRADSKRLGAALKEK